MKRAAKTVIGPEGDQIIIEDWKAKRELAQLLTDHIRGQYPKQKVIEIPEEKAWVFYRANWQERDADFIVQKLVWKKTHYQIVSRTKGGDEVKSVLANMLDEQFMVFADYFMPQQEVIHPEGLPIYRESGTYGDLEPGMYLCLFHGFHNEIDRQRHLLKDMGLGAAGPMIGPLNYVHTSYGQDVKYGFASGVYDFKRKYGLDEEGHFDMADDCILYKGIQYGDWSVTLFPLPQ